MKPSVLLLTSAFYLVSSFSWAQKISDEELKSRLAGALADRKTSNGLGYSLPSSEEVLKAIAGKNGQITIDAGRNHLLRFEQKTGNMNAAPVIIGSSADSLVAQSNLPPAGETIVTPPIEPSMSVTVLGGTGRFCLTPALNTEESVSYFLKQDELSNSYCQNIGSPKRITKPGRYLLVLKSSPQWKGMKSVIAYNLMGQFIEISPNEHKVIPLRKITIAAKQVGYESYHWLYTQVEADFYQAKNLEFLESISKEYKLSNLKTTRQPGYIKYEFLVENKAVSANSYFEVYGIIASGNGEESYYVLPGVYMLTWQIKGPGDTEYHSAEPTMNIYVE